MGLGASALTGKSRRICFSLCNISYAEERQKTSNYSLTEDRALGNGSQPRATSSVTEENYLDFL